MVNNAQALAALKQFIREGPMGFITPQFANECVAMIESQVYREVSTPQTQRLLCAIRDIFPNQPDTVADFSRTPSGIPFITLNLGYRISHETQLDARSPGIEGACTIIADAFLERFYALFGKEPQTAELIWREHPTFCTWNDLECRDIRIGMWLRWAFDPPQPVLDFAGMAQVNDLAGLNWIEGK